MAAKINMDEIYRLVNGEHGDPFSVLGMHKPNGYIVVRAFLPRATKVTVVDFHNRDLRYDMEKILDCGFFEASIRDGHDFFEYQLEITDDLGQTRTTHDPYSFLPVLSDYDLHLFNEGTSQRAYEKMGAHPVTVNNVEGVLFAVWAPTARRVSVVGDFNQWDGRQHPMRLRGTSGVWEIFIPGLMQGDIYKYEIKTNDGRIILKADPYAFCAELRPKTASVVYSIDGYNWGDQDWMEKRRRNNYHNNPMAIYEVHLGSWAMAWDETGMRRFLTYRELADRLVSYVKDMGFTHIELLPVAEYPFDGSWGYQVTGYYAVTGRYGTPEDFMYFVDMCHQNGIGVIMDWVPGHFPKDIHGLVEFDGTALYEHADSRQGEHPDWGTLIFNYGRNEVRSFLISNAVFWFEKYHIDGLRVDAVASMLYLDYAKRDSEWIPNRYGGNENIEAIEFFKQLNSIIYCCYAGAFVVAEESSAWPMVSWPVYSGGLGFGFKWNMGWMNDFLSYMSKDPVHRKYHHNNLTFSMMYTYSENYILPLSHDEVVHGKCSLIGKMPGDYWQKFANLRLAFGYMYGHPGKKLIFMGGEFGQFIEWKYDDSLDWHLLGYDMHAGMQRFVKELNRLYVNEKALYEADYRHEGFEWIDCSDSDQSIVSFVRRGQNSNDILVFVCNFTPVVREHYRIGVPFKAYYKEVLNSDSKYYGGSNVGNNGGLWADDIPCHGRPHSLGIRVPPLAVVVFKPCAGQ